jgi:hypothetical protein
MTDQLEFYRRRERQERAAAKQASSLAARRVHRELAILYTSLRRGIDSAAARGGS